MRNARFVVAAIVIVAIAGCEQILQIDDVPLRHDGGASSGKDGASKDAGAVTEFDGTVVEVDSGFVPVGAAACYRSDAATDVDAAILTSACLSCITGSSTCSHTIQDCSNDAICACLLKCIVPCTLADGGTSTGCQTICTGELPPDSQSGTTYSCLESTCGSACNPL